jgi:DNA processing protein
VASVARRYHLAALVHAVGRAKARCLLNAWPDPARALAEAPQRDRRNSWDAAALVSLCRRFGIALLLPEDDAFPPLLRGIPDPPPLLYVLGDPRCLLRPAVAVVGARRCTRSGAEVAAALGRDLAGSGVLVVSGLARGIDTAAHRGALATGLSAAAIGSGLARPYPTANRGLLRAITDGGGVALSEYPPLAGARKHHFPERNRLISGLARAVVVVEAGEHSGSLITARLALEQGRDVCAVPGSVSSPASRGCHRLLRQGATLIEQARDVLEVLGLDASSAAAGAGNAGREQLDAGLSAVLEAVEATLTPLDRITAATGLSSPAASALLLELELNGFVRQVPGGYIRRPLP